MHPLTEKPRLLVVDDERLHLSVMVELLGDNYVVMVAKNGEKALQIARSNLPPALILLDVLMPGLDGYQVCQALKDDPLTRCIPVIFLTVKSDVYDEAFGFGLGAVDYIIKPFSPPIVRARVATHLALKIANDDLAQQNQNLEEQVVQRTEELRQVDARRRQLLIELQQAQRMDSLGQLTGGVAHDFNNILSVILGYTDMAKRSMSSGNESKVAGYLEQVETAGQKAGALIEQLLAFTRGVPTEGELLNLGEVVENGFGLLRPIIPSGIIFKTDFDRDLPLVELDQVGIYQVIMNLCINARDAMGQQGEIAIKTGWFGGHGAICATCGEIIPDQQVELVIADQGKGIAPEHINNIFTALFSTKPVGKGTGMGLAVVNDIVHSNGGHLLVDSRLGGGTSFKLVFPVGQQKTDPADSLLLSKSAGCNDLGAVLVVVQEASHGVLLQEYLEQSGWQVTVEDNVDRALAALIDDPQAFTLVIIDHSLPGLDGLSLLSTSSTLKLPSRPIICISSDEMDQVKSDAAILQKPFNRAALMSAIAQVV